MIPRITLTNDEYFSLVASSHGLIYPLILEVDRFEPEINVAQTLRSAKLHHLPLVCSTK